MVSDDRHAAIGVDHLAAFGQGTVAAVIDGQIDDHRAGLHGLDHLLGDQDRCRAPGDEGGGDDHVLTLQGLGQEGCLLFLIGVAHLLGVAAGGLGLLEFLVLNRQEGGAQAFDLLLGGGPYIGGRDHGAQAASCGDGLQTGNARAHHQHLGWTHRSGRRHHQGENLAIDRRAVEHRLVAGQVRLG